MYFIPRVTSLKNDKPQTYWKSHFLLCICTSHLLNGLDSRCSFSWVNLIFAPNSLHVLLVYDINMVFVLFCLFTFHLVNVSWLYLDTSSPCIIVKMLKTTHKREKFKSSQRKMEHYIQRHHNLN